MYIVYILFDELNFLELYIQIASWLQQQWTLLVVGHLSFIQDLSFLHPIKKFFECQDFFLSHWITTKASRFCVSYFPKYQNKKPVYYSPVFFYHKTDNYFSLHQYHKTDNYFIWKYNKSFYPSQISPIKFQNRIKWKFVIKIYSYFYCNAKKLRQFQLWKI